MKKLALALLTLTAAAATVPFLTNENEDEKEYFALTWYARKDKKSGSNGFTVDLFDPRRTVEGILRAKTIVEETVKAKKKGCAPDAEEEAADVEAEDTEEVAEAVVADEVADEVADATEPEEA